MSPTRICGMRRPSARHRATAAAASAVPAAPTSAEPAKVTKDRSPNRLYAIWRLKAALNAWRWRVAFRRRGKTFAKAFYDLKYGGSNEALAAAIEWRDQMLTKAKVLTHGEFHAERRSNNTSGVAGVHLVKSAAQPLGAWQALIKLPNGRRVSKSFSILKYGLGQAFRLATATRANMLTLIDDEPYLADETAKAFAVRQRGR